MIDPPISHEEWAARGAAAVLVPADWTRADVVREAAALWSRDWLPACRGGAAMLLTPDMSGHVSLTGMFLDEGDSSWPEFAQAVWDQLVVVCEAMMLGNRRARRMTRTISRRDNS